jgi:hypothetical protein
VGINASILNTVGNIGGMTFGPVWFVWLGLQIHHSSRMQTAASVRLSNTLA